MLLSIQVSPEAEAALRSKAAAAGVDIATYAARQLELMVNPHRSFIEISGPVASNFANSGMSEDELSNFLEEEKHQLRTERRAKKTP